MASMEYTFFPALFSFSGVTFMSHWYEILQYLLFNLILTTLTSRSRWYVILWYFS